MALFKKFKKRLGETELTIGKIRGRNKSKPRKLKDVVSGLKRKKEGTRKLTQRGRQKEIGASKGTKVSRGAKSVEKTKGGEYVKYAKESRAGGSFKKAFAKNCKGGEGGSFSWQGRSYSCGRSEPTAKQKAVRKAKKLPGGLKSPRSYT